MQATHLFAFAATAFAASSVCLLLALEMAHRAPPIVIDILVWLANIALVFASCTALAAAALALG